MAKSKKAYCVECGTMNEATRKKCIKCHKNPNPKDHAFKDYIFEKIGGKVEDSAFDLATKIIKKYLYGILMSCSILFTGAAFFTNVVFNDSHIEKVTDRPSIAYLGEGLSALEVVSKYVDAAKDGDLVTVYGLQLEKTEPDMYDKIITLSDNSSPDFGEKYPFEAHTVVSFAQIYFKDDRSYEIFDYEKPVGFGKYGEYDYYRYNIYIDELGIKDQVEVVNVDGNFYVTGEVHHYEHMNLSDIIYRGMIYNAGGDLSKVNFDGLDSPDLCGDVEDCLSKFSGMEVNQKW